MENTWNRIVLNSLVSHHYEAGQRSRYSGCLRAGRPRGRNSSPCKGKDILVEGRGSPYSCAKSRLPHFLEIRLTDGGDVVSPMHRKLHIVSRHSGTHFCSRLSWPQGHSATGRIKPTEKFNDFIWNRARDFSTCGIVPQSTTLPRALRAPVESRNFPSPCR
jgi:hypothetical protein